MTLRGLPSRVRTHLVLSWASGALAFGGVAGFALSFWQVASPAQAATDVHADVPYLAYGSIAVWIVGLAGMWYSRRVLTAEIRQRRQHLAAAASQADVSDAPASGDAGM